MPNDDIIIITPPVKPQSVEASSFKRWWRSKTVWLGNTLIGAAPVLEYARDNSVMLAEYIGKATAATAFGLGMLIIYLRKKTTEPLGK